MAQDVIRKETGAVQKYLAIFNGLKAVVYVSDMQTCEILFANKYTKELFGEIEGKICWQSLQDNQDGPCSFCTNDKIVDADGNPTEVENWELCNTRNGRWYEMHDRAIEWVDDRIVRLEIAYDITERKQSFLRRTRALEVLRRCNASLIRCDHEKGLLDDICQTLVEVGKYRMAWVGYGQDDREKTVQPESQFGDHDGYLDSLDVTWSEEPSGQGPTGSAIRTGQSVTLNISPQEPRFNPWTEEAGKRNFKSATALPLRVEEELIGALTIYAEEEDAFDQEEMELLVELAGNLSYGIGSIRNRLAHGKAQEELYMAHEQLAVIMESLPIIPFTREISGEYAITYMSKAVEEITGYPPMKFVANPSFWPSHVHPEDLPLVLRDLHALRVDDVHRAEYRFKVLDGSYRWFNCVSRVMHHSDSEQDYVVGAWQDIHDEKMMRVEAKQRMQQVIQADKLASLGEVVAGVAHEINNPNSFITYNIPLLQESWDVFRPIIREYTSRHPGEKFSHVTLDEMADEVSDIIDAIHIGSDRINAIVTNLKDFARMDESSPSKRVDINAVITDTLTIVGAQVRKLVGKVVVELAEGVPSFHGHFQKLEQVMANILVNSAHAVSERSSGRVLIRTRFCARLDSILVEIEDNGRGMEPAVVEKIFDPFFTTKRDSGGTGLGLSVSYGLIQEHGGTIAVLSRPGIGSKFTVFLPVDRRKNGLDLHPTILCIDNDPVILALLNSFFTEAANLPVEIAGSGEGVVHFLEEHPEIDIVVSDINMPGVDGWQLLTNIKQKFPLLPVIFISGDVLGERGGKVHDYAPDGFIEKPISFSKLVDCINRVGRQRL